MNIEATKLELIYLLLQTQKESLLAKVKSVFEEDKLDKRGQTDWWDEMSETEKREIETGLAQADKGDYVSNEVVMKRFNNL